MTGVRSPVGFEWGGGALVVTFCAVLVATAGSLRVFSASVAYAVVRFGRLPSSGLPPQEKVGMLGWKRGRF